MYDNLLYEAYGYSLDEGDAETQKLKRAFNAAKTWEAGQRYVSSIRSSSANNATARDARGDAMQLVAEVLVARYQKMIIKHFNGTTFKDGVFKVHPSHTAVKLSWPNGDIACKMPIKRGRYVHGTITIYFPYDDPTGPIRWRVWIFGAAFGPTLTNHVFVRKDAKEFFKKNFPNWDGSIASV